MADFLGATKGKVRAWGGGLHHNADDLKTITRKLHLSGHWLLLGEGASEYQAEPATPPIEHPMGPFATRLQEGIRSLRETDAPNEVIWEAIFAFLRNPQSHRRRRPQQLRQPFPTFSRPAATGNGVASLAPCTLLKGRMERMH